MKKAQRVLCLIMSAAMMLAAAGCGNSGKSSQSQKTSSSSNGKYDFGGKTVKVAVWYEPEKPSLGVSDAGDAWYYSLKNAEEEFNCKVEWVITSQDTHFSKFVQASLAGEVYADILMCHSWNYVSLIKQKMLEPTTEFINNSSDADHWNTTTYVLNGENWGLNPIITNYTPNSYFLINTKLLKSLNLDNPQKLARDGKWTWDKFREYCKAATNVSKEQYGVGSFSLATLLRNENNFKYIAYDDNGVAHNGFTYGDNKTRGMELLELLQQMGTVDKSIFGSWDAGQEALDESINAFKDGKLLFTFYPTVASLKKSGFTDYSVVTVPLGPSNNGLVDIADAFAFWSLPTNSDFTAEERAAFWMEAKRTWDPSDEKGYYEASEEDALETLMDDMWITKEDAQFMLDMGKNLSLLPGESLNSGTIIADSIYGAVIRGDSTPAQVISSTDGELQALVDSTYNSK